MQFNRVGTRLAPWNQTTSSILPLQSIIYTLITTYPTKTTNKADTAHLTVLGFIPLVTC